MHETFIDQMISAIFHTLRPFIGLNIYRAIYVHFNFNIIWYAFANIIWSFGYSFWSRKLIDGYLAAHGYEKNSNIEWNKNAYFS